LKIDEIGEFGFIESIQRECTATVKDIIKGIGDDCAVIGPHAGRVLLFTTDMLVEDIHFVTATITPYQLGWKSIAVNLSDIAAMGGRPRALLISLAIPPNMDVEGMQDLYRGMKAICRHYQVTIAGGDTVASPEKLVINVSLIGDAKKEEVLYRSGAQSGDEIYLTGTVGDSSAGLRLLKNEISSPRSIAGYFIQAHNKPKPLIDIGMAIAASRLAHAMIDVSDGLLSDLGHICKESDVGAMLFQNRIPLSSKLRDLASRTKINPLDFALSGGEDYVLLVTVPQGNIRDLELLWNQTMSSPLYSIGEIQEEKGVKMVRDNGSIEELDITGFNHFSH
jgi:thiamine-monophosphate kinase